jgi:hypothetical protein
VNSAAPDPGRAARGIGEAGAVLCRILHPQGRGAAGVWTREDPHDGLLASFRDDARTARALPVVATLLLEAGLLPILSRGERALAEAARAWGEVRAKGIARLTAALAEAAASSGARVLLCKAAALHGLIYADPAARPAGDVDAFVPGGDVARLHAALLARGFRALRGTEARIEASRAREDASLADVAYEGPDDLHLEVKADPIAMGMPIARTDVLVERRRPSPCYAGLWVPAPEVMVLQQVFSLARRPVPDVLAHAELAATLARDATTLDVPRLLDLLHGEGLDGVLRGVLEATAILFPGTVPHALLEREDRPAGFVPRRLRAPLRGHARTRGDALLVWLARGLSTRRRLEFARWLVRRALPPRPLLATLADDASTTPALRMLRRAWLALGGP